MVTVSSRQVSSLPDSPFLSFPMSLNVFEIKYVPPKANADSKRQFITSFACPLVATAPVSRVVAKAITEQTTDIFAYFVTAKSSAFIDTTAKSAAKYLKALISDTGIKYPKNEPNADIAKKFLGTAAVKAIPKGKREEKIIALDDKKPIIIIDNCKIIS